MKFLFRKKRLKLYIGALLINFLISGAVSYAQVNTSQSATLSVLAGNNIDIVAVPGDFNFPPTFIPNDSSTKKIYKTLPSLIDGGSIIVGDSDINSGFRITVSASDFTSGSQIINQERLSLVTISESLTQPVDTEDGTTGISNVVVPLNCDWDEGSSLTPQMQDACDSQLDINHFQSGIEKEILSNTNVNDIGVYTMGLGLRFDIDNSVLPGNYTGTLTFTKIVI